MTEQKQPKTRIPAYDNERLKQVLGNTTTNDFLAGAIYDLLNGAVDEEYYELVAELRELQGETAEVDGRINRIDDRIEELEAERERLAEERDEKRERIEELEDELADASAGSDDGSTIEDVAYELLVAVANGEIGTNGLAEGHEDVQQAAVRVDAEPGEVIKEMRRLAEPALDSDVLQYADNPLETGFLTEEQDYQTRLEASEFDLLRRAVAEEVVDEEVVDWDQVVEVGF